MALEAFHDDDQPKIEKKEIAQHKTEKKEQVSPKETPIDQQKFIEKNFIRLDNVFDKESKKVKV